MVCESVYADVCMYMYVYLCMCIRVYVHWYVYVCACLYVCECVCIYVHMFACVGTHVHKCLYNMCIFYLAGCCIFKPFIKHVSSLPFFFLWRPRVLWLINFIKVYLHHESLVNTFARRYVKKDFYLLKPRRRRIRPTNQLIPTSVMFGQTV